MNGSMQKGISALKEAVEKLEDETERLCQYLPKAESIVTGTDDGKICALPGEINKLLDTLNDINDKRIELRQRREENDHIIDTYHQELCSLYEGIIENITS